MSSNIDDDDSLATHNLLPSGGSDDTPVPAEVNVEDDGSPGDLELHVENDTWLKAEERTMFFHLLAQVQDEAYDKTELEDLVLYCTKKAIKTATKDIIIQELQRRKPGLKINKNNTSRDAIRAMLTPLEDPKDIAYAAKKVKELVVHFRLQKAEKDGTNNCRQTGDDRVRFAGLFNLDDVCQAYWNSQNSATREELDAGVTPMSKFQDLISAKFNDETVEIIVGPYPNFGYGAEVINCKKGEYNMTPEKVKKLLNDLRRNLNAVIERYERSGNGSNQRAIDSGELTLEDGVSADSLWGKYNAEAARAAASAGGAGGLSVTMDGDDRANFLRHEPKDTLIVWDIFDKKDLLRMACAKLGESHMASSESTPATTARGSRSRQSRRRNRNARDEDDVVIHGMTMKEFDLEFFRSSKVRRLDRNFSQKYAMINNLKSERFELFLRLEDENVPIKRQMFEARCGELTESIAELESELEILKEEQKKLEAE